MQDLGKEPRGFIGLRQKKILQKRARGILKWARFEIVPLLAAGRGGDCQVGAAGGFKLPKVALV